MGAFIKCINNENKSSFDIVQSSCVTFLTSNFSRMISKQFHYQLRNSEKQAFVGPPDNMREHVLAAAKGMFYFHVPFQ